MFYSITKIPNKWMDLKFGLGIKFMPLPLYINLP